jgi:hypothetical protein
MWTATGIAVAMLGTGGARHLKRVIEAGRALARRGAKRPDRSHALQWLREMAVPVPTSGLAQSAAQTSHQQHPAGAADRDGNDAQRDRGRRAAGQTLPEHGIGDGRHERADRDRGREGWA